MSAIRQRGPLAFAIISLAAAASCDDEDPGEEHGGAGSGEVASHHGSESTQSSVLGPPTGTTCPSGGTMLTYESFARDFMQRYCLSCHSEKLSGAARNMAPDDHNFDTYADVDLISEHIDRVAGSGPSATNMTMPPKAAAKRPTLEERKQLSEWIACGLAER